MIMDEGSLKIGKPMSIYTKNLERQHQNLKVPQNQIMVKILFARLFEFLYELLRTN